MINESHIQLKWDKPEKPGGKNDFYELSFKEKSEHQNKTIKMYNVTGNFSFFFFLMGIFACV